MVIKKGGIEIHQVRNVQIGGNPFNRLLNAFFNRANRDAKKKRDIGLKGSRDTLQSRRRRRKKVVKDSRKRNR